MRELTLIFCTACLVWGYMVSKTPPVQTWLLVQEVNRAFYQGDISYGDSVNMQNDLNDIYGLYQSAEFKKSLIKERLDDGSERK